MINQDHDHSHPTQRDRHVTPAPKPLVTEIIDHERKRFFFDLIENHRGRALRLTEDVGGRRDRVMIPAEILPQVIEALQKITAAARH